MARLFKIGFLPFSLFCFLAFMALLANKQVVEAYTFFFSMFSIDSGSVSKNSTMISNTGHVVGFFSLAILCHISTPLRYWQIALLCIALSASLELAQKLLTYRQCRWEDLLYGVLGTFAGLRVVSVWETMGRESRDRNLGRGTQDEGHEKV